MPSRFLHFQTTSNFFKKCFPSSRISVNIPLKIFVISHLSIFTIIIRENLIKELKKCIFIYFLVILQHKKDTNALIQFPKKNVCYYGCFFLKNKKKMVLIIISMGRVIVKILYIIAFNKKKPFCNVCPRFKKIYSITFKSTSTRGNPYFRNTHAKPKPYFKNMYNNHGCNRLNTKRNGKLTIMPSENYIEPKKCEKLGKKSNEFIVYSRKNLD